MISVKLINDNTLAIRVYGQRFNHYLKLIKNLPSRSYEDYQWLIPRNDLNALINAVGERQIAWLTSPHKIRGLSSPNPLENLPILEGLAQAGEFSLPRFQQEGASFLIQQRRCILADEVGLGKTIQTGAAIKYLLDRGYISRALVITSSSIKMQFASELQRAGLPNVVPIVGSIKQRKKQWISTLSQTQAVAVINYDQLLTQDMTYINALQAQLIVVDEAHYMKSHEASRTKAIKTLSAEYRWLLTATPVENKPEELHSLLGYIQPHILGSLQEFRRKYVVYEYIPTMQKTIIIGYRDMHLIHELAAPYMLRRSAVDAGIATDLPKRRESYRYVKMTRQQELLHESFTDRIEHIRKEAEEGADDAVLGYYQLQMEVCNTPELLRHSSNQHIVKLVPDGKIKSPKLDLLVGMFDEIKGKTVIFTKFRPMVTLINHALTAKGIKCTSLHGSMSPQRKEDVRQAFNNDPEILVLISTEAGQEGINLTSGSVIINFDMPWKPTAHDQRIGRLIRMGNINEEVLVINIIATSERLHSVDEQILGAIQRKKDMIDIIVEGE